MSDKEKNRRVVFWLEVLLYVVTVLALLFIVMAWVQSVS